MKTKSTNIEWLGEIPEQWEVKKLRHLLHYNDGIKIGPFGSALKLDDMAVSGYKVYGQENVISKDFNVGHRFIDQNKYNELEIYAIKPGDILITMMGTAGRCIVVPDDITPGIMDSHLIRLRLNKKVYSYLVALEIDKAAFIKHQINLSGKGSIMQGLNSVLIKNLTIPLPPLPEQIAIAKFLDRKTAEIDSLIAKKEKLLVLLAERRSSLISEAVTGKLTPDGKKYKGKVKESRVEWLGLIPESWNVWKLFHIFKTMGSGTTPNSQDYSYYDGGSVNWLNTSELRENEIFDTEKKITEKALKDFSALKIYNENSLVIAMYGATIGRLGILKTKATVNQACCVLSNPLDNTSIKFIYYFFIMYKPLIIADSSGGGQPNINANKIKDIKIPLPPISEQIKIIDFLDKQITKIGSLKEKVEKTISKLKEYRAALISATVTGKVRV